MNSSGHRSDPSNTAPFTLDDLIKSVSKDSQYRVGRGVTLSKTTGAVRAMVAAGRVSR